MNQYCFIYKITNTINSKKYIGFTTNLHERLKSYRNVRKRDSRVIAKAIRKYTWKKFVFEVIYCSLDSRPYI